MDDITQKYLDEVDLIKCGCQTLIDIIDAIDTHETGIIDGFTKLADKAIAKCNTASYIIKIYGATELKSSERLMQTAVDTVKQNYIPVVSLALMYINVATPGISVIRPEA